MTHTQMPAGDGATDTPGEASARPIFVDLDGTLIAADTLMLAAMRHLRLRPLSGWLELMSWTLQGKPTLKAKLSEHIDVAALPYRQDVLEYLWKERQRGRPIILSTASHRDVANRVANHLDGLFDEVLATDSGHNLKGTAKLAAIEAWCQDHSASEFCYIGDSSADIPLWAAATEAGFVGDAACRRRKWQQLGKTCHVFSASGGGLAAIFQAMRPHQWVKNTLVAVPLLLSPFWMSADRWLHVGFLFLAFCSCASAGYLLNDLKDIEDDIKHPSKRRRPIAAGRVSPGTAALLTIVLLVAGVFTAAVSCSLLVGGLLAAYFGISFAYTLWLKRMPLVDIIVLAILYSSRVLSGVAAGEVELSFWLLTFAMLIFLSLALVKRYHEIQVATTGGHTRISGRGYHTTDAMFLSQMGISAAMVAVLVFCLYINSQATHYYNKPYLLWAVSPLLLYWLGWIWLLTCRGQMRDDPLVFTLTDRTSLALVLVMGLVVLGAKL